MKVKGHFEDCSGQSSLSEGSHLVSDVDWSVDTLMRIKSFGPTGVVCPIRS